MMAFCPEHSKWDQNPKFTPLSERTSIPTPSICRVLPPPGPAMYSTVFWCLLVLFLVFWLYCITTVTPFKRRSQGWSFLSGCRVLDQSQQKCRFLAEIQIHCKVFQLQPKRETSFSSLGDNEAFCAKRKKRGGESSTPNIVGSCHLRPCW